VITTDKKQTDRNTQLYVITVTCIPFLNTRKVTSFYAGISAYEEESSVYIWTDHAHRIFCLCIINLQLMIVATA